MPRKLSQYERDLRDAERAERKLAKDAEKLARKEARSVAVTAKRPGKKAYMIRKTLHTITYGDTYAQKQKHRKRAH